VMSEESTTPDLVELQRRGYEAVNRRDFDMATSIYAPDAVWDMRELGVFEGRAAIRAFLEDWFAAYEDYHIDVEEILDLGNGVTFAVIVENARLVGGRGEVRVRQAQIGVWARGAAVRVTNGTNVEKARTAAERLAESRG
jgi:ketosteroid isomerase-like protein